MFFKRKPKAPEKISLYFYNCNNAGDILNQTLINDLFGIPVKEESFETSDMIAVGSLLERIVKGSKAGWTNEKLQKTADKSKKITVWGTGLMHDYDDFSEMEFVRPVEIRAVRGELTRKACEKILGEELNCVTADPGILAPFLLDKIPQKKYKIGIIPHFREYENEEYLAQYKKISSQCENSVIIDLSEDLNEVLKKIASCETVMSASLHGLIFADSFGIPGMWCEMTDIILGNGYKYRDYYSSYGLTAEPYDLRDGGFPTADEIKKSYKVNYGDVLKKQKQLIKCFPYQNKRTKALIKFIKHGGFGK